jgi:hypothetical protein
MRWSSGLENHPDLVAYWKFNDPDQDNGAFKAHAVGGKFTPSNFTPADFLHLLPNVHAALKLQSFMMI